MSNRYIGGVVTETTNVAQSPWSGSWTPQAAYQGVGQNNWPLWYDPYFNYVTLLLHGDGTNAAQNNTFLDSSTNNFTITRNGNTTQGTFSPFSQSPGYWGNYFDGSSAYLSTSASAISYAADFTVECWFNTTTTTAYASIYSDETGSTGGTILLNNGSANGQVTIYCGSISNFASTSTGLNDGKWHHVAFTRSGSTVRLFIDGALQNTTTASGTLTTPSTFRIGNSYFASRLFAGYISNFRVTNTAVYTSNFTPSTTPLTAISGTSLLTCQSNRFIDNSTNNFAITANGTPSVQAFSPFAPTSAYSTTVNGGSGYFDGSGDYLTTPSNSNFNITGDFTIEGWLYVPTGYYQTIQRIFSANSGPSNAAYFSLGNDIGVGAGKLCATANVSTANPMLSASVSFPVAQWTHIALVRSGSSVVIYQNGVAVATTTNSDTWNFNNGNNGSRVSGTPWSGSEDFQGYISNLRVVIGSAVYTANFTPPTAPLTAITNTSLLLSCTNAGILDNSMKNDLETVGNAQISTSVKKYGTGSMYFDGTGGYAVINKAAPILDMTTGNFTLECWFYPLSNGAVPYGNLLVGGTSWTTGSGGLYYDWGNTRFTVHLNGLGTNPILVTGTAALSTWHHIALVRNGTTLSLYLDGTLAQSMTISSSATITFNNQGNTHIGGGGWDGASGYVNGYIDDLRITKGIARYTANFTPPTQAFQNQ